ncbi:MAG: adenylate/guanylate cyclase domain-containing protein, partial [Thermomicrobiales bacterium]|nr:adenylate/guanylate cyclase domain-containing protein [Thermomicrobiales bacterium]
MDAQRTQRTFLFTDIEGSTRLWEQRPEAMPRALAEHNRLIRTAVDAAGGRVFKIVGDAFCADFAAPGAALRAAIEAQRGIECTDWLALGLGAPLRVRKALHQGRVEEKGGELAGPVLNRIARLLAAGHGGQILMAGSVEPVSGAGPGVELRSLGERKLRDVPGTEHIVQVVAQGLQEVFPPINTLDPPEHNLPAEPNAFFGREAERARIRRALLQSGLRLVTLLGPGGIGKTRLSIQAGNDLLDSFAAGVRFVELAGVRDDGLVAGTVMRTLGVREESGVEVIDTLCAWLSGREILLIFDNCEQVIEGAADLAATILRRAPGVRLLATSRIPLEIRGEQRLPVDPLEAPETSKPGDLLRIRENPAVRLFVDRAVAVDAGFSLDTASAPHVAEICRRVDGIPLAIELAAARIAMLSPEALLEQLERRLPALTGGARDLPDRHKTLQSAIAWSYDLLDEEERDVFRKLSVFVGGWTLDSAKAVLGFELAPLLATLGSKSLIRSETASDGNFRFVMLETIREFAVEQALGDAALTELRSAHANWALEFSECVGALTFDAEHQLSAIRTLSTEYGNISVALSTFDERGDGQAILRLATAIWRYWSILGAASEGKVWIERALAMDVSFEPMTLCHALNRLGNISVDLEQHDSAVDFYRRSLSIAIRHRNRSMMGRNLCSLGMIANMIGGTPDELRLLSRGRRLCEESGDTRGAALATLNLAISLRDAGEFHRSAEMHLTAIELLEQAGDRMGVAGARY